MIKLNFLKRRKPAAQQAKPTSISVKATKANKLFTQDAEVNLSRPAYLNAYTNADLVYSCVSYASDIISQLKIKAYKVDNKGKKQPYKNKVLLKWLEQPNPYQSMNDILYVYSQSYFLAGNAYLTFEKVGTNYEGWILNPTQTKIVPDEKNYIKGFIYSDTVAYDVNEVLHFKNSVLVNEYYGQSYLAALADPLSIESYGIEDLKSFYANSLVAQGIFTSEYPLTKEQIEALKEQFKALYGQGGSERYGHIIAPNGLDYKPLKFSPKDAMLIEALQISEERIYKVFRLNPLLLGIPAKGSSTSASGIAELKKIYINNFIRPIMSRMISQWQTFFRRVLKDDTLVLEADYSSIPEVNTALEEKIGAVKQAVSLGILSINEARQIFGFDEIQGELADKHFVASYLYGTEPTLLETGETLELKPTNNQPSPNGSLNQEGGEQDGVSRNN